MAKGASDSQPILITQQNELNDLVLLIENEGRFGFDTEFVMEDRYESEVCLLQLATSREVYIIDPFLKLDISPIWDLVREKSIETIVHAGMEDLALCYQHTEDMPKNVFDVQIAAGLISHDYPLSLQKLVKNKLHIQLHKSKTLTDWRKRPLTDSQIRYAAEDVAHLLPIRRKLYGELKKRRRLSWAREEFAIFELESTYRRAEEETIKRVKGTGSLDGMHLAIAQELIHWREHTARKMNRPARTILKDHLLVEIARHGFTSLSEVRDLRGINLSTKNLQSLCNAVKQALALPSEQWPKRNRSHYSEKPEEASLVALVTAVIRSYCMDEHIAYSLAATKRDIQEMIRRHTDKRRSNSEMLVLLSGWRGDTVGRLVHDVLLGAKSIRIKSHDERLKIDYNGEGRE